MGLSEAGMGCAKAVEPGQTRKSGDHRRAVKGSLVASRLSEIDLPPGLEIRDGGDSGLNRLWSWQIGEVDHG